MLLARTVMAESGAAGRFWSELPWQERMHTTQRSRHASALLHMLYCTMRVVIGRGPTPVKICFRLRLQNFVADIVPQPLVRVLTTV
jgi:hypothetical protein